MAPDTGTCIYDIYCDLCKRAANGITIEELKKIHPNTYNLNLYLPQTVRKKLIRKKFDVYRTTPRGLAFMSSYEHMINFLSESE